jgi:ATP-dependent Clp protease ATP-binding subunit ClpB
VQGAGHFLFDSEEHLIRVDMSEFMEKHSVARLIGAPPGYVGYEEGGYLTEAVRRKPYSVILLDEVEKAHHDVFNVLLQVLDDGRLTDGQGRTVDFKNTVIVMTSNIGSHMIQAMVGKPYEDVKEAVWDELKNHFRPEFLNRIDETVVFHGLGRAEHIAQIAKIQLRVLEQRWPRWTCTLQVSPAALEELAKVGFDPVFGARPLKRAIQQRIENPLSRLILEGRFPPKSTIPVEVDPVREPGVPHQAEGRPEVRRPPPLRPSACSRPWSSRRNPNSAPPCARWTTASCRKATSPSPSTTPP